MNILELILIVLIITILAIIVIPIIKDVVENAKNISKKLDDRSKRLGSFLSKEYVPGIKYLEGDIVYYKGTFYKALKATKSNPNSKKFWEVIG